MDFKDALDTIVTEVEKIVNKILASAPFDKTYSAIVLDKSTSGSGYTYTVKINGKNREVFSKLNYSIGDYVYVLVPRNNITRAVVINIG